MSFGDAIRSVLSQYATFTGRARRSEYWWWVLATNLLLGLLYLVGVLLLGSSALLGDPQAAQPSLGAGGAIGLLVLVVMALLSLALFVPTLAVSVRRLHDTDRTGWWVLISFVPFGGIVMLVFQAMDSTPGHNQHGPNPKAVGAGHGYGYDAPPGYGPPPGYAQPGADPRFGTAPQG